jgi:hypothetical protein
LRRLAERPSGLCPQKVKAKLNPISCERVAPCMSNIDQAGALAALLSGTALSAVVLLVYLFVAHA